MTLWTILFLLVIAISFILALRSMKDYQHVPQKVQEEYGLFLIRNIAGLTKGVLDSIHELMLAKDQIISIERLFKGQEAVLTIFGPKKILERFGNHLKLLELEDYATGLNSKDILIWEVGIKDTSKFDPLAVDNLFGNLSVLSDEEKFFWQVSLNAKRGNSPFFNSQIRAVLYTKNPLRKKDLAPLLQNLSGGHLVKIPKPFSPEQMISFYNLRSLEEGSYGPILSSEGILHLLKIS